MGKEELFGGSRGAEGEKENLERVFLAHFNWGREDVLIDQKVPPRLRNFDDFC